MTTSIHDDIHPCVNDGNEEASRKPSSTTQKHAEDHRSCDHDTPSPRRGSPFLRLDNAKTRRRSSFDTPRPRRGSSYLRLDNAKTRRGSSFMQSRHAETTHRVVVLRFDNAKTPRGLSFARSRHAKTTQRVVVFAFRQRENTQRVSVVALSFTKCGGSRQPYPVLLT